VPTGTNVTNELAECGGVSYFLERSADHGSDAVRTLATNLPGQLGTTTYMDTNVIGTPGFLPCGRGN
jgi:hypothetical protein